MSLGLTLGCRKHGGEKATTIEPLTTEPLVDEDYQFRISWPGPGWTLLGESDARQVGLDAIAGVTSREHVWGVVTVERFSGDLEETARWVIDNMAIEEPSIESHERLEFQGKQAERYVLKGRTSDTPVRYVIVMFMHQGHLYKLLGWGPQGVRSMKIQPFFDAFSLLDGKVIGRANVQQRIAHASGPGWRLQNGMFLSAAAGLQVKPPEGWHAAVGAELKAMDPDAEIGLVAEYPELYITVTTWPASAMDEEALQHDIRTDLASAHGELIDHPSVELTVAGEKRSFGRVASAQPAFEFLYTAFHRSGRAFQIVAWYVPAQRAEADKLVPAAVAAIKILGDAELDAARRELAAEPDRQNAVGDAFSLRRGVYRDFAGGWTWRPPAGFWRIRTGQDARAVNPEISLFAHDPATGLSLVILAEPLSGTGLDDYAEAVRANLATSMKVEPAIPPAITLGNVLARAFDARSDEESSPLQYRVVAAVHEGTGVQIHAWADAAHMPRLQADVDAAVKGFRFAPGMQSVERTTRTYRDVRMGFSFEPGEDGWRWKDETPPAIASLASLVSWTKGDDIMQVWGLYVAEAYPDDAAFFDQLEQRLREQKPRLLSDSPARKDVTVAGLPGRKVTWPRRLTAYFVRRDRTVYVLLGIGLDPRDAAELPSRFAFID